MSGRTIIYLLYGVGLMVNAVAMLVRPDFRINPIAVFVAGILLILSVVRIKL